MLKRLLKKATDHLCLLLEMANMRGVKPIMIAAEMNGPAPTLEALDGACRSISSALKIASLDAIFDHQQVEK